MRQHHQVQQSYAYVCSTIDSVCAIFDQSKQGYLNIEINLFQMDSVRKLLTSFYYI